MATYTFSALSNNQTLSFSSSDTLVFDGGIAAADVSIDRSVSNTTYFTANDKRIEISGNFWALATESFSFSGGGQFIFGDGTASTTADATGRKMNGTSGDDWLYGSSGADTFVGGAGDDQIYCSALPDSAHDTVSYRSSTAGIAVEFYTEHNDGNVTSDGLGGVDLIRYVDALWGSDYADALTLTFGEFGEFKLYAGDDDVYLASGGVDTLDGGSGTDTLRFAWSISDAALGTGGAVNVNLATGSAKDAFGRSMKIVAFENVKGTDYGDTLTGNNSDNTLTGHAGNDTLSGGGGTDTAVYSGSRSSYTITANGDGTTTVSGTDGTDTLTGIETLQFDGGETVTLATDSGTPDAGGDSGASAGTVTGTDGNNKLTGTADNDTIEGLAGNDQISGGAGDDIIVGGAGVDKLTGGGGADAFVFDYLASGNADKILDFDLDEGDSLVFDTAVFTALAGGIAAGNVLVSTKARAVDADDYLIFVSKGGKLYYDADGSGAGAAIQIAGIKGSFADIDYSSFAIQ